jgi:hypothetical protein
MDESLNYWIGAAFFSGLAFYTAKAWITELFWPWWKRRHSGYVADMTSPPVTSKKGNVLPHIPYTKTWQEIFNELPEDCELKQMTQFEIDRNPRAVNEWLWFSYYGPIEAWCEQNLKGSYILWSKEHQIEIMLFEERDRTLWLLRFGAKFPAYKDLPDLPVDRERCIKALNG